MSGKVMRKKWRGLWGKLGNLKENFSKKINKNKTRRDFANGGNRF